MISLKDIERKISIPMGSHRFEYLLAICTVEQQTLLQKKDDDDDYDFDQYYLRSEGIVNVVEHPSTSKNDEPKPVFKDKEAICLKKLRKFGKVTIKLRNGGASESGVSSSSDEGETAAPELNPSPNGRKRKRSRNEGAAAEMTKSNNKRKRGGEGEGGGGNNIQEPPPGLPERIKNLILLLPKTREVSAKLVIQKQLTETDVSNQHNRLSIPTKHIQETFLTEEEEVQLRTRNGKNVGSMDVPLITLAMEMATVSLRRWEMNKQSGPPSISYVLTRSWNKIREQNKLRSGMNVELWAIRVDGVLYMALTCPE